MGGYLDYYGLRDWYNNLPQDIQNYLYKSCGYGINTNSDDLLSGDISFSSASATHFLCGHALNALHDRNHTACGIFMEKAFTVCKNKEDSFYYGNISLRILDEKSIYPDQAEIDKHKPIIYTLIKNCPGILQSELKKNFAPHLENTIGLAYWAIYQEGKIKREKKGRSFQLWVVE